MYLRPHNWGRNTRPREEVVSYFSVTEGESVLFRYRNRDRNRFFKLPRRGYIFVEKQNIIKSLQGKWVGGGIFRLQIFNTYGIKSNKD
jgi:hypothetical protein